jgi:hypothetical protein
MEVGAGRRLREELLEGLEAPDDALVGDVEVGEELLRRGLGQVGETLVDGLGEPVAAREAGGEVGGSSRE